MKKTKEKIAAYAVELASKNAQKKKLGPFAAAVVLNGKIISSAANCVTSKNDPTAHAEIEAVRKAAKKLKTYNLKNCEIYASAKPCPMCLAALYWANIKKIYYCASEKIASKYGFKDEYIFNELKKSENKRKIKQIKISSPNGETPFKIWEKLPNKKLY